MPRKPRQASSSGFFHIIIRGIGKQILFEDKSDYLFFLSLLSKNATEDFVTVCAYCLMENHVHLLLLDQKHLLSIFMKKIGISYALYYNRKYQRTGHLFQDRFKSEPIESDASLLTVFRYILKNPEKAGICPANSYSWSSYPCYGRRDTFVDTKIFENLIGDKEQYKAFIAEEENDRCLEYVSFHMTDDSAKAIIKQMGLDSGTILQSFSKVKRNDTIRQLLRKGLSIRQIERLTGISRGVIQRIRRRLDEKS